jgi:predicted transposase YbfD/YdcC
VPRPARSRVAIERALAVTADAITATVAGRAKRRTWRAEVESLRSVVETLASTGMAGDVASAIGFEVDTETQWHEPDHGLDEDHEHDADAPACHRPATSAKARDR